MTSKTGKSQKAKSAFSKILFSTIFSGFITSLILSSAAKADVWAYIDDAGIMRFASYKVSERYKIFFKDADIAHLANFENATDSLKRRNRNSNLQKKSLAKNKIGKGVEKINTAIENKKIDNKKLAHYAKLGRSQLYQVASPYLKAAAKQHSIDYGLLRAVAAVESGFNPNALSPKGAVGLMQIMPTTAKHYGVNSQDNLSDPRTNAFTGAKHLAYLLKRFNGDVELAIAAYNAGEGAVQRAGNKIPKYKETQGYVKNVMNLYSEYNPAFMQNAKYSPRGVNSNINESGDKIRYSGSRVSVTKYVRGRPATEQEKRRDRAVSADLDSAISAALSAVNSIGN